MKSLLKLNVSQSNATIRREIHVVEAKFVTWGDSQSGETARNNKELHPNTMISKAANGALCDGNGDSIVGAKNCMFRIL